MTLPRTSNSPNAGARAPPSGAASGPPDTTDPPPGPQASPPPSEQQAGPLAPLASRRTRGSAGAAAPSVGGAGPAQPDRLRRSPSEGAIYGVAQLDNSGLPFHQQVGIVEAGALAARLGSLQPPRTKKGVPTVHPWERVGGRPDGAPLTHPGRIEIPDSVDRVNPDTLARCSDAARRMKDEGKTYLWSVNAMGSVFLGEATDTGVDNPKHPGQTYTLGHPTLVSGGNARICGEISFNSETGTLDVVNLSGRYSRYADRARPHAEEAARIITNGFGGCGLELRLNYVAPPEHKSEALAIRSHDPNWWRV
jgi:hypothetical protein